MRLFKGLTPRITAFYMTIETLIATIDQDDHSLVEKMNVQTEVLVGNQCSRQSLDRFSVNGNDAVYYNTAERGVGINRNLLLDESDADICILADDDMVFIDGYPQITACVFNMHPDADVVIFNLLEKEPRRYINKKVKRVRWYNYSRYGAARIALRRESINKAGIRFDQRFGGGARYCSGEDTVFLRDCLKNGLRIYAVPYALAEIDQDAESTWFNGYSNSFFYDKGALYACLHSMMWRIFVLRFVFKRRKELTGEVSFLSALRSAFRGAKDYRREYNSAV